MKKFILSFIMMLCCIVGSAQTYVYSVASDGYTNIRSTNSTNGRIIGELRNGGGYATLMQTSGSWYKVNYRESLAMFIRARLEQPLAHIRQQQAQPNMFIR